jgi:hypothetical protein
VKTRFHSYLYILKNNENILNQCEIGKWMHNNEKNLIFDHFKLKDSIYNNFMINCVIILWLIFKYINISSNGSPYHVPNLDEMIMRSSCQEA